MMNLLVYLNEQRIGLLRKSTDGGISFQYDRSWSSRADAIPVSCSLPVRTAAFRGDIVSNFFDNLLPDAIHIRKAIAARVGAKSTEAFDMLTLLGGDCIGALRLLPVGTESTERAELGGEVLAPSTIGKILESLKLNPLGMERSQEFRISLAGVQDKTALLRKDGKWLKPKGATPTTHIFKPSIGVLKNGMDLSHSVENEWLCLELCRFFGLETAKATIVSFAKRKTFVIERFDRQWSKNGKRIFRIPTEDLCQAKGIPSHLKYESDGGPGIVEIMKFLNASSEREKDRKTFFKAQMLFDLLGATDGHAKNFSVFLRPEGRYQLTPLYDVLSSAPMVEKKQVPRNKFGLAMAVGKSRHRRFDVIQIRHWEETARMTGLTDSQFGEIISELKVSAEGLHRIEGPLKKKEIPPSELDPILKRVRARARGLFE